MQDSVKKTCSQQQVTAIWTFNCFTVQFLWYFSPFHLISNWRVRLRPKRVSFASMLATWFSINHPPQKLKQYCVELNWPYRSLINTLMGKVYFRCRDSDNVKKFRHCWCRLSIFLNTNSQSTIIFAKLRFRRKKQIRWTIAKTVELPTGVTVR